jgi:hypothetical protein
MTLTIIQRGRYNVLDGADEGMLKCIDALHSINQNNQFHYKK